VLVCIKVCSKRITYFEGDKSKASNSDSSLRYHDSVVFAQASRAGLGSKNLA